LVELADDPDEVVLHIVDDDEMVELPDYDEPVLYLQEETPGEAIGRQVAEALAYHAGRIDAAASRRRRTPWAVT